VQVQLAIVSPIAEPLKLTEGEQRFLYNLEVLGMSVQRAAEMADVASPWYLLKKPAVAAAREQLRVAMRSRVDFTREDVIAGLKDAIDQGKIIADPMAQIAGWREIAKLQGYDKEAAINININGNAVQVERQIQGMTTARLLELSGNKEALDADFYEIDK
jgi:hypothetical protein